MKTKKYHVTDEDGSKYTVEEEIDEVVEDEEVEEIETKEVNDEDALTPDEISALKGLAKVADKLMTLLTNDSDDEEMDVEVDDEDEDEDDEEILDTDEEIEEEVKMKSNDSKKSFGSIGSRKTKDSADNASSIEDAWQKRYGG